MKKGFTIVEVSILFVIFLIVAFLVAPLSLDDTKQAKYTSRWRNVQQNFTNIFYTINTSKDYTSVPLTATIDNVLENEVKDTIKPYKIIYMNGSVLAPEHQFEIFKQTYSNATVATKFFTEPQNDVIGILLYDVNGKIGPNTWGKDVFGLDIYTDRFEPIGKSFTLKEQKQDCSRSGKGLYCSNYYLIGGHFD